MADPPQGPPLQVAPIINRRAALIQEAVITLQNPNADANAKASATALIEELSLEDRANEPTFKATPNFRMEQIPEFSGRRKSIDIIKWFLLLDVIFAIYPWITSALKIMYSKARLGPALQWFLSQGDAACTKLKEETGGTKDDYDVYKDVLVKEFSDPHQKANARKLLNTLRQSGSMTVSRLIQIFKENLSVVNDTFTEVTKIDWFRHGLKDEIRYFMPIDCWDTKSLEEIFALAIEVERNLAIGNNVNRQSSFYEYNDTYDNGVKFEEPTPMLLGTRHEGGGRGFFPGGRGRFGRGRGRFGPARGRGHPSASFNHMQQPATGKNRFPCHECGSFDHYVKDCPERKALLRRQEEARLKRVAKDDDNDRSGDEPSSSKHVTWADIVRDTDTDSEN